MLKMAKENEKEFPKEATTLKRDQYADDLIHSCPDTSEAERSMKEVDKCFGDRKF